ncbi:hypothetical protein CDL12_28094 [Handroanthus impetiginosus]|uniref:Pectinesterase inhibitor domain-containing protein n=1 Tax=Handroanthus impetiginosus TaxID=429701 RepID=A0A2G9G290_9LAMI|nr:hypothetical protein CDL12_28094 [Handroanthus impetiginosus]
MDYSLHRIISTALIFMITIPSSLGHRNISQTETNLQELCSQTRNSEECWQIIKSEHVRFNETDYRSVVGIVIDLAIAKADEIHDKLNQLHKDSRDNYNDANRNLDLVKRNLNSNDYRNIPVQINDTLEELRSCRSQFDNDSFDPAHIRNRNKEFRNYVDIVKVATDRLLRENDRN